MLSNISKLFKKGASSPSSKDRSRREFTDNNKKILISDPKVIELLGLNEEEEHVTAERMALKDDLSSEFSLHQDEESEVDDGSSPDISGVPWPQKSELPPSFEFARPTGQALSAYNDLGVGIYHQDTGTSKSVTGEESSFENGTATGSEEDNSVDSADVHPLPPSRTPAPLQTLRPLSPRPSSTECSSQNQRATPSNTDHSSHSPRAPLSSTDHFSQSPRGVPSSIDYFSQSPGVPSNIDHFSQSPRVLSNIDHFSQSPRVLSNIDHFSHSPRAPSNTDHFSHSPRNSPSNADHSSHSPRNSPSNTDHSSHSPRAPSNTDHFSHSPRNSPSNADHSSHSPRAPSNTDHFSHSPRNSPSNADHSSHSPRAPSNTDHFSHSPRNSPSNADHSSHSPRGNHSLQERSWGSNNARPEGVSWGSNGSVSPRWKPISGQPSPERGNHPVHPLPAPPAPTSSSAPHSPKVRPGQHHWGPAWTDASSSVAIRDWQVVPSTYKVPQSPSHHRTSPRSNLASPSPPRSPIGGSRAAVVDRGAWAPLPAPPPPSPVSLVSHSPPHPPSRELVSSQSPPHPPGREVVSSQSPYQSPPKSPSRLPRTLTKWKKIKQIGVGSFGTVHEAINLDDGSFFAVKVSHDESIPPEIQKEIEVLSMLRHPNVVQYYGTAMEDGHLCIFLELMQNSLHSIIKVFHHFDETLISTYTRQILHGLEYLHRKNTIHRDIKCANILVDKDGQVKLADFGLAKEVGMVLATSCKGTPYFMAPEILKPNSASKRGYGLPVDIWSLGCTVLEMADGNPPWSFLQGFSFFFKLNKGELPPIPQHLSPCCQDFIRRCLKFKPEERPTASQLLLHPFVANAPATAAAVAVVSHSPAAMFIGSSTLMECPQGRNGEALLSRYTQISIDVSGSGSKHDSPHHRFDLQIQRPDPQHGRPDSQHHRPESQHSRPDSQHHRPESQHSKPDSQNHRPEPLHARPDFQGRPEFAHLRPILQRSPRLDRSQNRSSSSPIRGTHDLPDIPRSPSLEAAVNYSLQHYGR